MTWIPSTPRWRLTSTSSADATPLNSWALAQFALGFAALRPLWPHVLLPFPRMTLLDLEERPLIMLGLVLVSLWAEAIKSLNGAHHTLCYFLLLINPCLPFMRPFTAFLAVSHCAMIRIRLCWTQNVLDRLGCNNFWWTGLFFLNKDLISSPLNRWNDAAFVIS